MHEAFDSRSAGAAVFAFAVVDGEAVLEVAEFAAGAGKVRDGGSAGLDGLCDHVIDGGASRAARWPGMLCDRRFGEILARHSASQT